MAQCGGLPGAVDGGAECTVDVAVVANGVFNIPKPLHILDQGKLTTTVAGGLTLTISGDLVIDVPLGATGTNGISGTVSGAGAGTANPVTVNATGNIILRGDGTKGAAITSDRNNGSCGTAEGGQISLISTGAAGVFGNITVEKGAVVTVNGFPCPAGDIVITTQANGLVTIAGLVESRSTQSGTGRPGGGTITVKAGCNLLVTGKVSSHGLNPGADLVHLEGCVVQIQGLVESTGSGHDVPDNPPNHCNGVFRPGKPANSTACVEIVGTTVEIGPNGEVNADTAITSGGNEGRGWIDVFGREVAIVGPAAGLIYAVHANQPAGNTGQGGLIRIVAVGGGATSGDITTSGRAVQANALPSGGQGGAVIFEALNDILFGTASIQARGANVGGGAQAGGTITATAYNGAITGAAPGELNADGGGGQAIPDLGLVTLNACTLVNYTGTVIPAPPVINVGGVCGGAPVLPVYVSLPIVLPDADCVLLCGGGGQVPKTGVKFNDLNQNGVKDPGEPGLVGWEIHLFGTTALGAPVHLVTTTTLGPPVGLYQFTLDPGTYTVCEVLQPTWTQSAPCNAGDPATCTGTPIPPGDTIADCSGHTDGGTITPGPRGYSFTVTDTPGEVHENNDFGNFQEPGICPEDPDAVCSLCVATDPPNAPGFTCPGGVPLHTTLQAAVSAAAAGNTICLFSDTTENVIIPAPANLTITQCTVAKIRALDPLKPVVTIKSTASKTLIIGADTFGGSAGWLIETGANGHELRGVRATGATGCGIQIQGNSNKVSFNSVTDNGQGVCAQGNSNDIRGGTVEQNTGAGVTLSGTLNVFRGARVEDNANGVTVTGNTNQVKSNRCEGNTGHGIFVTGLNNSISDNQCNTNTLDGFNIRGSGNKLKNNKANNNTGDEFDIGAGNVDQGGNKANGANCTFPGGAGKICN